MRSKFRPKSLEVLADAQFRALILSQAIFDLGIFIRGAAASWVVLELTHSPLWIGLVAGVRAIPILILPMFGGVIADRFDRRKLMFAAGLLTAAASGATGLLIVTDTLVPWHMVALAIFGGISYSLYSPAYYALIADIVPSERLSNANGILSVAQTTGEMIGPVITGVVIASSGTHTAYWLVVVGNLIGVTLLFRIREPERTAPVETDSADPLEKTSFTNQFSAGLRYARNTPPLRWLTVLVAAQNIFGVAIFPLMPIYAEEILEIGPTGFGLMGGVFGAGTLIGAIVISITGIHRRRAYVMVSMGLVWDIGMVVFGYSRSVPVSLAALFAMGLISMPWVTSVLTMFQQAAQKEMRARVMSLFVTSMGLFSVGWLFGGAVAEWIGNEEALVTSALLGTPVAVIALLLSKELRKA
ncbi:MFS transporter [Candidatus Lucifugimonas marina]|uniref:MFS transporter n=1 Tax=Candidatus Lucifugimonas marina TaxID=3038979 RepID=A0AAJ5ZEB6_9CHLR|nr:MFS transporter [SAR202 cluster bacterium JH702]MDG0869831.1 MFS transporter [SAR202 cluster bacterium JH639]WFG34558.1 MFS transporter [SAR202 cluster bacterium JH545]WFG38486.1 MFS transporter [SAR202 cluster bacterium JH1073]